eukprot:Hpha_TRINITY_DN17065_c0_g1::TRINITY_DN17065_c0_g1_i1::g.166483::m.166483
MAGQSPLPHRGSSSFSPRARQREKRHALARGVPGEEEMFAGLAPPDDSVSVSPHSGHHGGHGVAVRDAYPGRRQLDEALARAEQAEQQVGILRRELGTLRQQFVDALSSREKHVNVLFEGVEGRVKEELVKVKGEVDGLQRLHKSSNATLDAGIRREEEVRLRADEATQGTIRELRKGIADLEGELAQATRDYQELSRRMENNDRRVIDAAARIDSLQKEL